MPRVDIEIQVNGCYFSQLKLENSANRNLENLQIFTKSVEN